MGFFDLAVELRFHIYNLLAIAIPHSAPFSEYRGFYYTCRQIKCEIDQECGRFLRKHITLLQKNWKATTRYAHFGALPETWPYWSLQHIYLTLDPHAYFRMKQTNDDGFLPILNLHLESVSLALFVDSKSTASWEDDGNWIFYWVINQLEPVIQLTLTSYCHPGNSINATTRHVFPLPRFTAGTTFPDLRYLRHTTGCAIFSIQRPVLVFKRVKAEMDQEVGKIATTHLEDLAKRMPETTVSRLNPSPSLERLHFKLLHPPGNNTALFRVLTSIVAVLSLHTASVSISFTSSTVHLDTDQYLNALNLFNYINRCSSIETQTTKLVLEYPAVYWLEAEAMIRGRAFDKRFRGWSCSWRAEAIDEETSKAIAT
ncbi:hypothetical protein BKA63DRAFT_568510 [Paraphoma chrysanthemicola]|nr:hypothetical protein BKA63DRAFT_568510 [Paraphoma chrysanthemicola]